MAIELEILSELRAAGRVEESSAGADVIRTLGLNWLPESDMFQSSGAYNGFSFY